MNQNHITRMYTTGICDYKDSFLLLKIAPDFKYCPNDWEFVTARSYFPDKSDEENLLLNVLEHTNLEGKIIKKGEVCTWEDKESKINFIIWPCIVEVFDNNIKLSTKFIEYKWLNPKKMLDYDRLNYLERVLKNVDLI